LLLLAAARYDELWPYCQLTGFSSNIFDGGYEQAEKQKPAPGGLFIQNPGIPGRSIKPAQLCRLQEWIKKQIQYKHTYSLYGFAL
jgi:hypothetical protein